MKNVLLLIHDDPGQEARLQAALDLTRALGGHLSCLAVTLMPMVVEDYVPVSGAALLLADERDREAANRHRTEERLAREDVPWDWADVTGTLEQSLLDAAGLADIIVINRQLGSGYPDMRGLAGTLLVKGDTPILAVPEDRRGLATAGHALIAWDGSDQAQNALQAATPLLVLASEVTFLEIDDGSLGTPATEAARYLARHGVEPRIRRAITTVESADEVLLADIPLLKADYLVMGGYGRSRLTEAVFGGVTRRMLAESPVPLLMAR